MDHVTHRIARVEPLTRTRAVRGPFDYRLRPDQEVEVGSLLRIPFARRQTLGVVLELAEESELPLERLAEPDGVLEPGLPADLVALAGWMARAYCSTFARAIGLMLPPAVSAGTPAKPVLVAELTEAGATALRGGGPLNEAQKLLLTHLDREGPTVAAALGTPRLRRLEARGLVSIEPRDRRRRPVRHQIGAAAATAPELSDEQRRALAAVLEALNRHEHDHGLLLQGVTGSGKTEVYLSAAQAVLAAGRSAIVLVPEIALTPQALHRFQVRFGDVVAVLHSGLSPAERRDEWLRLRGGQARVCVGPRSAVFAPLADIGLIVIDEEHEGSYKHEGDPRYDARAVAAYRARQHGAVLLAGSATPRAESAHELPRIRLDRRIDGRRLPPVQVLDMCGHHHPLHPESRNALADVRRRGGKAIVLMNRRGWSNYLTCRGCGEAWMCPNCEVVLVLHRAGNFLACHHCGHREAIPDRCRGCGSPLIARHGAGTERIEHELREAMGDDERFPVFRLDADSPGLTARAQTLLRFQAAPAGVLVGTQMVAKGHDFPDVTLALVLDADQTLRFPDFRAEERTFALITQLAGRAGRGEAGGRVLVQTLAPGARAIELAANHDSDGFLAGELERRRLLGYPPFSSLIRIVCSAPLAAEAQAAAAALKQRIDPPEASVLGPAPLFALRGRFRSQLLVKAGDRAAAIAGVGAAVDSLARALSTQGTSVSVDVDPV